MDGQRNPKRAGRYFNEVINANTGALSRAYSGNGDRNCAMCTAAGVLNLAGNKKIWSTGMVAQAYGTGDHLTAMGEDVNAQKQNIIDFCQPMTGRIAQSSGAMLAPLTGGAGELYMSRFPDGTVFAINVSGPISTGNRVCHWLNAIKNGGNIEYVDFQADHKFRQNQVARGAVPVLGIANETISAPEMIVIAFPK